MAYYLSDIKNISGLCSPSTKGARPLVVLNPVFFDPSLPRNAVQLIAFTWDSMIDNYDYSASKVSHPGYLRLYELIMSLDYKKIATLLDVQGPGN